MLNIATAALALAAFGSAADDKPSAGASLKAEVFAVELASSDLKRDTAFYTSNLGFAASGGGGSDWVVLLNGDARVVLRSSSSPVDRDAPTVYLNYYVEDLNATIDRLRERGVAFDDGGPQPNAIGRAIRARDPSGHPFNLMQIEKYPVPPAPAPRVFNIGLRFTTLKAAESFYCGVLGLNASTRDHLPQTLPLARAGCAPLVLHAGAGKNSPGNDARSAGATLVLAVADLNRAVEILRRAEAPVVLDPSYQAAGQTAARPSALLSDPGGHSIRLIQAAGKQQVDSAHALTAFERFKSLAGAWRGKSTKGWTETETYRVIAAGSVVMGTSFDAHPNETMITMIHMDGDRLLLKHYCVAKNQPRIVATRINDDASRITFEFLDATNLPSRDKGHMDKAVFHFINDGSFTSRWTWYQDGKESWMEEIEYKREK